MNGSNAKGEGDRVYGEHDLFLWGDGDLKCKIRSTSRMLIHLKQLYFYAWAKTKLYTHYEVLILTKLQVHLLSTSNKSTTEISCNNTIPHTYDETHKIKCHNTQMYIISSLH